MIATFEKVELTTDQLYAVGFGDGLDGRPKDRKYRESLDYVMGHTQGYRANPNSLANVPKGQESYLERGWGDEILNPFPG
jgi:hypothetical protein